MMVRIERSGPLLSVCALSFFLTFGTGCSGRADSKAPPSKNALNEFSQVESLTLSKDDSGSGDAWIARLEKKGAEWRLRAGPHGETLTDDRADGRWIEHFLDTLRTLQSDGTAPPSTRASYGLDRPLFRIQWTSAGREQEIRIGAEDGPGGTVFAQVGSKSDAPVILIRGASVRMLGQLDRFEKIRERRLLTFELDDVDEIFVDWGKGKRYFQRQGEFWADPKNVRFRGVQLEQVIFVLDSIAHLQVTRFPDLGELSLSSIRAAPIRSGKVSDARIQMRFRTRQGQEYQLGLIQTGRELSAELSTRPGNRFGIHPEAGKWMRALRALPARAAM